MGEPWFCTGKNTPKHTKTSWQRSCKVIYYSIKSRISKTKTLYKDHFDISYERFGGGHLGPDEGFEMFGTFMPVLFSVNFHVPRNRSLNLLKAVKNFNKFWHPNIFVDKYFLSFRWAQGRSALSSQVNIYTYTYIYILFLYNFLISYSIWSRYQEMQFCYVCQERGLWIFIKILKITQIDTKIFLSTIFLP